MHSSKSLKREGLVMLPARAPAKLGRKALSALSTPQSLSHLFFVSPNASPFPPQS